MLPVWMYWEGKLPEWIHACQKTVFKHAKQVHLVSPDEFETIWDSDRDITLSSLHVAHRADFIRAYLLAKKGGLWIDSDCLVMKSLDPLLERLSEFEFIGYLAPQGHIANNFMAARPKSEIASTYYQEVCSILRSGKRLEWLTIGSLALTSVVKRIRKKWLCLDSELIQPIPWYQPGVFFRRADPNQHAQKFNKKSSCYMISRININKYQTEHPNENLMDKDTFFSFLLAKTMEKQEIL